MVTDLIERIQAALRRDDVTPGGLARKAGLHRNTLYGAEGEKWNPTATVLKALEPHVIAIERGEWSEEQPTSEAA
jgi:DNA-binding XRE family transcriptional regulator